MERRGRRWSASGAAKNLNKGGGQGGGTGSNEAEDGAHQKLPIMEIRAGPMFHGNVVVAPPVALLGKAPDPGSNPTAVIGLALFFVPKVTPERQKYCPRERPVPKEGRHFEDAPALDGRDHQVVLRETSTGFKKLMEKLMDQLMEDSE